MSIAMKPFLEWEVKLIRLLGKPLSQFRLPADFYKACVDGELALTINDFRKDSGWLPHPDDRGNAFVYTPNEDRPGDDVIPPQVLVGAWSQIVAINEPIQQGKASREELIAAYPELYAKAVQAAKDLGVELP